MTETDIIFAHVLDRYIEIRYGNAVSSIRFSSSGNKPVQKRKQEK